MLERSLAGHEGNKPCDVELNSEMERRRAIYAQKDMHMMLDTHMHVRTHAMYTSSEPSI